MANIRTFAVDQQFSAIQYNGTIYTSARHLHLRGSVMMTITYKVVATGLAISTIPPITRSALARPAGVAASQL